MSESRSNEQWIDALRSAGPAQEAALGDLRAVIMKGLPYALSKYLSPADPAFDSLVENTAQETLLRVVANLETFEGRSKLTTWAQKIAIRLALTELRRKRWEDVSLESLVDPDGSLDRLNLMAEGGAGPEDRAEQVDLAERVMQIIREELTERQREAMIAIAIRGMPISVVAEKMDTNRNALYKLLHDARLRLKSRMALEGLSPEEVLASFEDG
jgi:RNA polymerase sigma-70 factor (ECF subfamily)